VGTVGFYPMSLSVQATEARSLRMLRGGRKAAIGVSGGAKLFVLSRKNYFEVLCNSIEIIEKSEGVLFDSHRPS
jgi:hypothetical protein